MLPQCPCSGNGGLNPVILLAIVAGALLLFHWIKTLLNRKGVPLMNKTAKIAMVVVLIVAVGVVIAVKQKDANPDSKPSILANSDSVSSQTNTVSDASSRQPVNSEVASSVPKLVDLGATKCIPCKLMAPILEELKKEYKGRLEVVFVDVWENPQEAKNSGIKIIPTQIFYDASGKELYRHEGFFSKEDILGKWKEFGINLEK